MAGLEGVGVWLRVVGRMAGSLALLEGTGRSSRAASPMPGSSRVLKRIGIGLRVVSRNKDSWPVREGADT
ncbi:hypothetical protein ACWDG9_39010 [Streptomyces sp. NPDC001073]